MICREFLGDEGFWQTNIGYGVRFVYHVTVEVFQTSNASLYLDEKTGVKYPFSRSDCGAIVPK